MDLRRGTKVTRLTQKVGQHAPVGRVQDVHGDEVHVEWEDGHVSTVNRDVLFPVKESES